MWRLSGADLCKKNVISQYFSDWFFTLALRNTSPRVNYLKDGVIFAVHKEKVNLERGEAYYPASVCWKKEQSPNF